MLYCKTEVQPSQIQGLGLFALEPIPAGTLVLRSDKQFDKHINPGDVASFPKTAQEFLATYGWRYPDGTIAVTLDNGRFINHSATPNLIVTFDPEASSYAARDIAAGEELTEDYSSFDPDFASYASELR